MATRIDIELTSRQNDGKTFTWRAAGARQPKGVADASLFPAGSEVGQQFKVEADVDLDGTTITAVIPAKEAKSNSPFQTLDLIAREDEPLVTQQLAEKGRGGRDRDRKGGGRGRGRDGDDRGPRGPRGEGDRDRGRDSRGKGGDRPRTPAKPKLPPKPKAPRLKAGKAHRNAMLDNLPEEHKVVAEQLVRGGLQGVRQAIAKQNEERTAAGDTAIDETPIIALAEKLLAQVRVAEWRDRAEAALEQADTVDLRDLRTVVTAADGAAKDDETRAIAAQLRSALNNRLEAEHDAWVAEIIELLDDDRVVRALHQSSRPPKAGAPLPAPVAMRLVEAANASMTSEIGADRWGYILDALAHSPVRRQVVPASLPSTVTPELKGIIARHGARLPEIAEIFGIEPDPKAARAGEPRKRRPKKKSAAPKSDAAPKADDVATTPETSQADDTPKADDVATTPETSQADAAPEADDVATTPETSEADDTSKADDVSPAAEVTEPPADDASDTPTA